MMFRILLAVASFISIFTLSACHPSSSAAPMLTEAVTAEVTPETTEVVAAAPEWIEEQANGVEIGMWKPVGWSLDSSVGLTLMEHSPSVRGGGSPENGIIINIFSPNLEHMELPEAPEDANQAL